MSPPPRPQSEDYLSSTIIKKNKKKKRQNKLRRPCPTPLLQSEDTGSAEASSGPSVPSESSKARNVESSYGSNDNTAAQAAGFTAAQGGTGGEHEPGAPGPTLSRRHLVHDVPENPAHSDDSAAMISLRRISQSMTQSPDPKRRESRNITRTLTGKFNTVFRSKGDNVVNENVAVRTAFGFRRKYSSPQKSVENTPECLSPTSHVHRTQAPGLSTPASINLTKPSGAFSLSATVDVEKMGKKNPQTAILNTSSNLVAFQTKRRYDAAKFPSPEEAEILGGVTPLVSSSLDEEDASQARSMSITRLSNPPMSHLLTFPTDTALTVTSFYPAPASSRNRRSGPNSISVPTGPRRFSVVQFVSRNSTHEVIWYEDESSNSGASTTSANGSQTSTGSTPRGVLNESKQNTQIVSVSPAAAEASDPTEVHDKTPLHRQTNAHKRLLSWSWDDPQQPVTDNSSPSAQGVESAGLHLSKSTSSMRRAATADISETGYFVPVQGHGSMSFAGHENSPPGSAPSFVSRTGPKTADDVATPKTFDRGLAMFKQRAISLGSIRSAPMVPPSIGEKHRAKSSGSQLEKGSK
jgi:hypothetical protein